MLLQLQAGLPELFTVQVFFFFLEERNDNDALGVRLWYWKVEGLEQKGKTIYTCCPTD